LFSTIPFSLFLENPMNPLSNVACYGRHATEPPQAYLWGHPKGLFAVRMACRTDGQTILLARPDDIHPPKANGRRRDAFAIGYEGRKFAFHRHDPRTNDLVFWPVARRRRHRAIRRPRS
jgi:hypothetical protein